MIISEVSVQTFLSISRQTSAGGALHSLSDQSLSRALPRAVSLFTPVCACVWEGHCSSSWLRTRVRSGDGARETRGGLLKHFRIWWRGEDNYIHLVILKNAITLSKSRILQQTQCGRWQAHLIALQLNKTNMLEMRTFL